MRSDILVHWTGKDIKLDRSALQDKDRADYVSRLASILKSGFWMTIPNERIEGKGAFIKYEAHMTCFTEIRLSQTRSHSERYGLMGIGVSRRFVLDSNGGPVHYVRNHQDECIVLNSNVIINVLKDLKEDKFLNFFAVNSCFIKGMSDANTDNFIYLNEQEWRIVHTYSKEDEGKLVASGDSNPAYRIPVQYGDVCVVVFPDDQTRTMARSDPKLKDWFQDPSNSNVILLTLNECDQF